MKRLVVHIDRLVVNGLQREDGAPLAQSLRDRLAQALAAPEMARHLVRRGDMPRLTVDDVRIDAGATPARIGVRAAWAIANRVKS